MRQKTIEKINHLETFEPKSLSRLNKKIDHKLKITGKPKRIIITSHEII